MALSSTWLVCLSFLSLLAVVCYMEGGRLKGKGWKQFAPLDFVRKHGSNFELPNVTPKYSRPENAFWMGINDPKAVLFHIHISHLYMDYEEDDDVSFAKWMSSFWGHNVADENEREGRAYRKRQTRSIGERRASLPAKLSSIHMTRLHASTKTPSSSHLKCCKELQEDQDTKCHCHMKACKKSSNGNSSEGTSGSKGHSDSIQEFSESFQRQLHFKNKRSVSLEPEGMKERREREKLRIPKGRSHKKVEEKEPKREQEEGEHSVKLPAGKHS